MAFHSFEFVLLFRLERLDCVPADLPLLSSPPDRRMLRVICLMVVVTRLQPRRSGA